MMRLGMLLLAAWLSLGAQTVVQLDMKGAISPASAHFLQAGLEHAKAQRADMLLVLLDTPGGLASAMREMIQQVANSAIPVVLYVHPRGAHAASAGTFLLYAAHVAAMSPGTNLGAATPVSMLGMPKNKDANQSGGTAMEKKVLNDAMAYITSLAELHDRNVSFGVEAVREGKSIAANEALAKGVIDLIARDTDDLMAQLDGRVVRVLDENLTLHTNDVVIIPFAPDWKTELLSVLTDPNIAYILLMIAMYGILFELMNPGALVPGTIGAISGVLALYALNVLPFNYAGLLLIGLGAALMMAEVYVAGFGILGIGGTIAFAIGSVLLFDAQTLGRGVSLPLIIAISLASLGFFLLTMKLFVQSRRAHQSSGKEEMIGMEGEVVGLRRDGYWVHAHGEEWKAKSSETLNVGDSVVVEKLAGLVVFVSLKKE